MTYEAIQTKGGWTVKNHLGCLLSENGHSFLAGDGFGSPKIWREEAKARAVADWLSTQGRAALSNSQRRALRHAIVNKYGLATDTARGLLQ